MDTAPQWPPQDMVVKPMEEICQKPSLEKKVKSKQQSLNCPRCNSTNTKFCYYNNYSLSQPRYFCKTCRRYWTEGGSLRNIPVGGGSRKNKRPSSSSSSSSSSSKKLPDLVPPPQNPSNLGFLTGLNFMPAVTTSSDPGAVYSSGFPSLPHFKPSLNFSLDGLGSNYGSFQGVQETNGKLLFPFEDLKQVSGSNNGDDRDQQHGDSSGYWNGVIGGGGSW